MMLHIEDDDMEEDVNDDGEGAGEVDEDEDEKKGINKIFLFLGVLLLLLIGGGAGAYFSGVLDPILGKGDQAAEDGHGELEEHEGDEDGHGKEKSEKHAEKSKGGDHGGDDGHGGGSGNFVEMPSMIVNLSTEDGTPRYLRLKVQLEMENSGDVEAVQAVMPRVVDQFQTYLRELRVKDLRGSAGIYRLQMELLWRVNQAAAPIEVKDVLFQEILIQ